MENLEQTTQSVESSFEKLALILFQDVNNPTHDELIVYNEIIYIAQRAVNTISGYLDMNKTNNPYYTRTGNKSNRDLEFNQGCSWINVKSGNTAMKIEEKNKLFFEASSLGTTEEQKNKINQWIKKYFRSTKQAIIDSLCIDHKYHTFKVKPKKLRVERPEVVVKTTNYQKKISQEQVDQYQRNVIYNMMGSNQDQYRDINKNNEYSLNEIGLMKIRLTFESVLRAYQKFSICSLNDIFTHETATIRQKILDGKNVSMSEIGRLFDETTMYSKPILEDKIQKSQLNSTLGKKRLFNSCLYSTWYMREKYDYDNLKLAIGDSAYVKKIANKIDKKLSEFLGENFGKSVCRIKGDFEKGIKAQRSYDNIGDGFGGRTILNSDLFDSDGYKKHTIKQVIKSLQEQLLSMPLQSGNSISIKSIKIVNKYEFLSTGNKNTSEFRKSLNHIKCKDDTIKKSYSKSKSFSSQLVQGEGFTQKVMETILDQLLNGDKGSNGKYEDIKLKIGYDIVDSSGLVIIDSSKTGGIEWQIIFDDSNNEACESNHELVLSSEKFLDVLGKNKSSIGLDEAIEIYRGGIKRHVEKMKKWNNTEYNPKNDGYTEQYIKKQFPLQNTITIPYNGTTQEIIFSHGLSRDEETALAIYFLQNQLDANKMLPLFYENDLIDVGIHSNKQYLILQELPTTIEEMYIQGGDIGLHKFRFLRQNTYPYLLTRNIPHKSYIGFIDKGSMHLLKTPQLSSIISENPLVFDTLLGKMSNSI